MQSHRKSGAPYYNCVMLLIMTSLILGDFSSEGNDLCTHHLGRKKEGFLDLIQQIIPDAKTVKVNTTLQ